MRNRITDVKVGRYPVLVVTFADGFSGSFDVGPDIATLESFAPLKDLKLFSTVAAGDGGYRLGWRLDALGNEIDYSSETIRNDIETNAVKRLAEEYRKKLQAAE
jgi:Protein of unknown function (DUF2442)